MDYNKKFDPLRVASIVGWTLLILGVCGMTAIIVVQAALEYVASR